MTRFRRLQQELHRAGTCPTCLGTGRHTVRPPFQLTAIECPACAGTGSSR